MIVPAAQDWLRGSSNRYLSPSSKGDPHRENRISDEPLAQLTTSSLVAYGFEEAPASSGTVERLPAEARRQVQELHTAGELTGKVFECTLLRRPAGMAASKLLVVGAGKREKFNGVHLRHLAGTAVRHLRSRGVRELAWIVGSTRTRRGGRRRGRRPTWRIMMRTATGPSATARRESTRLCWRRTASTAGRGGGGPGARPHYWRGPELHA